MHTVQLFLGWRQLVIPRIWYLATTTLFSYLFLELELVMGSPSIGTPNWSENPPGLHLFRLVACERCDFQSSTFHKVILP